MVPEASEVEHRVMTLCNLQLLPMYLCCTHLPQLSLDWISYLLYRCLINLICTISLPNVCFTLYCEGTLEEVIGISNTIATIPGMVSPVLVNPMTPNVSKS